MALPRQPARPVERSATASRRILIRRLVLLLAGSKPDAQLPHLKPYRHFLLGHGACEGRSPELRAAFAGAQPRRAPLDGALWRDARALKPTAADARGSGSDRWPVFRHRLAPGGGRRRAVAETAAPLWSQALKRAHC